MIEPKREGSRPVSNSDVWKLLMDFYARKGPEAWRSGKIPQRITSNGYTADVYASIVTAFLRDWAHDGGGEVPLILEVGGGSGLFAWLFMNRLLNHHLSTEEALPFEYLLTDAAESNVRAWMDVPRLRKLVDRGPMDMAVLKAAREIRVEEPRTRQLSRADLLARPVILIANYVFDSLPAELIRVRDGRVFWESLSIDSPHEQGTRPEDFSQLEPRFESHELASPYTEHAGVNDIIERYRALDREGCIPLPLQAISFLENFLESDFPFLLLAGDMAYTTTDFEAEPPIIFSDYIACTVNFHMLGELFGGWGGGSVFADRADSRFSVGAFLKPGSVTIPRTEEAARNVLRHFTPLDAQRIEAALEGSGGTFDFRTVYAWLRLARFDALSTDRCIPHLIHLVEEGETIDWLLLHDALLESFRSALPGVSEEDPGLDVRIAYLFVKAKRYREAWDFLTESMAELGRSEERLYLLGLAAARLGRGEEAARLLHETLEIEPGYWEALAGTEREPAETVSWLLAQKEDDAHLNHIVLRMAVAAFARLDAEEAS